MKFTLFLAFVTVCCAYPHVSTRGRNVNIDEDGTIVLSGDSGKKIIISKTVGGNGQQNVDISVSGPKGVTKRIQIDDDVLREINVFGKGDNSDVSADSHEISNSKGKKHSTQGETVLEILGQYQGDIDEVTYQQLLRQINAAVQSGHLDGLFYEVLKNLGQDKSQDEESQIYNQQQNQDIFGNQLQKQHNILDLLLKQGIQQKYTQKYHQGRQISNGAPVSMTPNGQQQSLAYKQEVYNPYEQQDGVLVGNTFVLPDMDTQSQFIEQIGLEQPQVVAYSPAQGLVYGLKRSPGPAVSDIVYISSTGLKDGKTTLVQVPVDFLNIYGTQNLQQRRGSLNQIIKQVLVAQPAENLQLIQKERELLDQQRQTQQVNHQQYQKEQQYHQQQKLLQQFGQEQQQMQQKNNQKQYQQEQQFLKQQEQPFTYFLSTSPGQNKMQQTVLQQLQGSLFSQRGLNGENVHQQHIVPLVVY